MKTQATRSTGLSGKRQVTFSVRVCLTPGSHLSVLCWKSGFSEASVHAYLSPVVKWGILGHGVPDGEEKGQP
jgi:hypothetical protein